MLTVKVEIKTSRVADLLCCALEGGSNYWCSLVRYREPPKLEFRLDPEHVYKHIDYPLNEGGAVILFDMEDRKELTLDYEAVCRGLQVMAEKEPRHYADFISENDDATTGDVFLQCCLFGEVIYG